MTRTAAVPRNAPAHVLALARVRALAARPAGPFRVVPAHRRTQPFTIHHQ
ncbi:MULTISPECIES: hypothetical protein [Curtobacterium]|nr:MULTISPECIES: hypothetical protein [Curtobacterium]MBT1633169.1 hypothetical protein [Curtobacterium flaccumfaciens pv. oortii]MCE0457986.1 hypothetical protein [Curtobacterium allii]MCS5508324.1 hypothetical protein [Curtobacterium flaccumfaciens pv. flaccumfaciens]MCS5520413.1 hypothetical protein [Curtobacterium flaccumfaciens]MCS5523327.1 hypothetical protein [Curtobacterium flaccumfaciens pv. oortii]